MAHVMMNVELFSHGGSKSIEINLITRDKANE